MDSKHKLLLSPVIDDNTIALMNHSKTVYLRLKLRQVDANGVKTDVQFRHSPDGEDYVFVALFDDNDIDFEILLDNRSTDRRRMAFTMTYGKDYEYIISRGLATLRAVQTNGNHLRFLSPNKPMANLRESSEILCSRIGFAFEAEKGRPKVDDNQKITIKVLTQSSDVVILQIDPNETIGDIKNRLRERYGIHSDAFRLIFECKHYDDYDIISDCGIQEGSILEMYQQMSGGGDPRTLPLKNEGIGQRGAIGFGDQTRQQFGRNRKQFIADEEFEIKPFVIELRIRDKQPFAIRF
ncbi:unnamed protein product [Oppiella nova]|uniref:Ubiquitin-like domain-containing protein n=1 Tax=Oppiella nova TaxID=334625 RepID=A0A7R9LLG5_9ACAR|nr:unnamed protein product [Oppiella nova]CAG2164816.1 unnamed protein product [Oppiella nova]